MRYSILILLFSFTSLYAQVDGAPTGGITIPRAKTTVKPTAPAKADTPSPSPKAPVKRSFSSYTLEKKETQYSMVKKDEFVSRGSEFEDRVRASVAEKGESNEAYRGNQYFGEVKTEAEFVQIMARDFGQEDNDRIKVMVNDVVIVPEIILDNDFKGIQITLSQGFNKIDFEALNQGTVGPNTAEFRVYDDKEQLISNNQWNLATGFKATVIVIKE